MNSLIPMQAGKPASGEKGREKKSYSLQRYSKLLLLITGIIFCGGRSNAQGTWSALTHNAPHANDGVMLVLTDGTIMCRTSSGSTYGTVWDKLTPDAHGSYLTGTWTSLTAMHNDRLYFSSQVLPNGNVYVAGGEYGSGGNKGEVYNPQTNTWSTPVAIPDEQIRDANSEILANGNVLQAVVVDTVGSTEYLSLKTYQYNPSTGSYAAGPNTTGTDNESAWVKLPDGSVLYVNRLSTNSERYIPATNTWIADGTVPIDLYDPYGDEAGAGFLLPNGKAFFIGSSPTTALYTPSGSTANGTWTTGPNFPGAPQGAPDAPAAMMVNGNILCVVSPTPTSGDHFPDSSVYFEYNYTTNSFTTVNTPFGGTLEAGLPTYIQNMVCLPNGTVLFSYQGSEQYYIYTPGSAALAAGQPTVSNVISEGGGCDTFMATGTLFNGITEGAAYGDDWQNASDYPLVRLTSGTNVYYARTYNWNRIGAVMTGAALDTVQFILPATLPTGTYTLQVVANGNASAGTPFNTCGVSCSAPAITGTATVCMGATTTLSDATTGGTWTSSNTAIAQVNASSGAVTGMAAGTATIKYTVGGCTATEVVTVNAISAITGTLNICNGASTTLADAATGGTWNSGNAGAATVLPTSGNVSGAGAGTSVITYTSSAGCTAFATVTVNAAPGAITGVATTCAGATIGLGDAVSGGIWSSSAPAIATIDPSAGTVSGLAPGTATITYSLGSCFATAVITVNSLPSGITGASLVCTGATITLSDVPSGGGWGSDNAGVATVNSSGTVSGLSPGTATISYTVTNGCGTNAATQIITVDAAPVAGTMSGTATACVGASTSLTDGAGGGVWSSSNGSVATVDVSGNVYGVTAGTATIAYTVTVGCGSAVAAAVVTINGAPAPGTVTGTATVCASSSTALSDLVTGGTWNSGNAGVATVSASGSVGGVSAGTATISYTVTNGCGSSIVTNTVTVNAAPVAGAITGTATVCVSATTTLIDATTGGVWSSSSAGIASVSTAGAVRGVAAGSATITYTLTNSCGSGIATSVVTVNAAPTAGAISGTATVCAGATTALGDATTGGVWNSSNTGIATVNASGTAGGVAAGTATISYTITGTCGSGIATKVVTVSTTPSAGTITGTASVCVSATTTLSDATTGGVWNSSSTGIASVSTAGAVRGVAAGTAIISYTVTNSCGSAIVTKMATVNAAPAAGTISGTATVCVSATTALSDVTTGGVWSSSSTTKASVSTAGAVRGVAAGTATISYTVTNTCGSAAATKVVTVSAVPTVATISGSTSVAVGATISLTDATTGGVWTSSNTSKASVSTAGAVRGVATGSATISYTVTNTCGTAHATKAVTVTKARGGRESQSGSGEENVESSVKIFPNPTSGTFNVTAPNTGVLHLFTMEGKEAGWFEISESVSSFKIPEQLAPGVYIYQFIDNNGAITSGRLVYKP